TIMLHEVCASGAGTSGASPIHFYLFPPVPVIKHGSEALKRKYLPRIATGEIVMSFGVTEPNAGTDTSRIQTRAERKDDRYVVNGRKVWNTNARQATHILLLARTSPRDAVKPFAGMTLFFTEFDRSKITVREIEKLGRAAAPPAKRAAPAAGFEACDVALQTHGGYGYAKEFYVERLWREIRLYTIAPVSQQMVLNYLSEHVLGLPRSYCHESRGDAQEA